MGFKFHKMDDILFFHERRDIIQQCHKYLREIRKYRKEVRPIVYLDETWANSSIAPERLWLDEEGKGGWKRPSGKGRRLIILHAGSKNGWTPNCALVFRGDYHDEINGEHFLNWFEKKLLQNVPERSVVVLDNAPYHNAALDKLPTKSSTKTVMKEWLTSKIIAFEDTNPKADLFARIRDAAPNRKLFQTNDLARRLGHVGLRSPVAHCELNPIELAWSKVKRYLKEHNQTFKLADLEELVSAAFQSVTPEMWRSYCKHVEKKKKISGKKTGCRKTSWRDSSSQMR
ncbi:uncharacterized protein LOC134187137 [Corticium candelabrum]|uniref:uncharacterized protein LOC134187137 n=1 Tax=Corticium candelabrum TaxID=121492 RepID=UPI002E26BFC6|nr:uncharacterized protein LOC134187137 [Corticium candelabrum]